MGTFAEASLVPVEDWGTPEIGGKATPFALVPDGFTAADLQDNSPCDTSLNQNAVILNDDEGWITLPNQSSQQPQIVLEDRRALPFDFRLWALGPGDTISDSVTLFQVPIEGAAIVSAPSGLDWRSIPVETPQGVQASLQFVWDDASLEESENISRYVVRWTREGDPPQESPSTLEFGALFFTVDTPPPGNYTASISAVDFFGQESEPSTEISFEFTGTLGDESLPARVSGLEAARALGAAPLFEILSPDLHVQWRPSSDPLFSTFVVETWQVNPFAGSGIDPTSENPFDRRNLIFRGRFEVMEPRFDYPQSLNEAQSGGIADTRVAFVVTQQDVNGRESQPMVLFLDSNPVGGI